MALLGKHKVIGIQPFVRFSCKAFVVFTMVVWNFAAEAASISITDQLYLFQAEPSKKSQLPDESKNDKSSASDIILDTGSVLSTMPEGKPVEKNMDDGKVKGGMSYEELFFDKSKF